MLKNYVHIGSYEEYNEYEEMMDNEEKRKKKIEEIEDEGTICFVGRNSVDFRARPPRKIGKP